MKKLGFMAAILALVLIFGLAFVSCGGDENNYDRTIEELFNRVKADSRGPLCAITADGAEYYYSTTNQRWELENGTAAPNFTLSNASQLLGYYFPIAETAAFIPSIPKMISILGPFFDSKYKTKDPQWKANAGDPATMYGWYFFCLYRNGVGYYGGTTQTLFLPA